MKGSATINTESYYTLSSDLKAKWDAFMERLGDGNLFQTSDYFEFHQRIPGYQPLVIISSDRNDEILGLLSAVSIRDFNPLIRFLSRRIIVQGGPLILPDVTNPLPVADALLEKVGRMARKDAIYIEFRNRLPRGELLQAFENHGYSHEDHLNFIVHIAGPDKYQNIHKSKIRQIRKSLKNGAVVCIPDTFKEVRQFYLILKNLYKTKIRKPLPPLEFFREFYENGPGVYLLIRYQKNIIGGIMCGLYKDTIYELYVAGLDKHYDQVYPSVLATAAAIEYATGHGLKYFDFMGAGKPGEEYGVRKFKSQFGGQLINPGRFLLITRPGLFSIGKLSLSIWKNLRRK